VTVERDGVHALACLIGSVAEPDAVVAVARRREFYEEERDLLAHLCRQATVSAANARSHELLRAAEARLRHQAFHDVHTGLANRALFTDRVSHALRRRARDGRSLAVLFLNLDGFKLVNDRLGHDAGDELLLTVARRIEGCVRPGDTAARFGGDEFALLLEEIGEAAQAEAIAERVRVALAAPVHIRGGEFHVRASVGLVLADAESSHEKLLRRANLAMYAAKGDGGDRVQRFHPEMLSSADSRTELAYDLRAAAAHDQLELHYQPIVDLADGSIHGVEALVRWRHPEQGLLAAGAFIGLAEEAGAMEDIERFRFGRGVPGGRDLAVNRRPRAVPQRQCLGGAAAPPGLRGRGGGGAAPPRSAAGAPRPGGHRVGGPRLRSEHRGESEHPAQPRRAARAR
jgi:diguanylate cyclase (GGDEF)-like protein